MSEQIVVKSAVEEPVLSLIETYAPELQYLGIIKNFPEAHSILMNRKLNYVGLEVLFEDDLSPIVSEEFFGKLHKDGKLIWGNSILYNYKVRLAGEHSDDTALRGDPELGWGYFARRGFDIIQTDWSLALSLYLEKNGLRYR